VHRHSTYPAFGLLHRPAHRLLHDTRTGLKALTPDASLESANVRFGSKPDYAAQHGMSAMGQKQTCALQTVMSALPPIATMKADFRKRSCPLYPRKRRFAAHKLMSALGQKRTSTLID